MKTDSRGLTLIELMVTLTVAGILLAVAVPAFREMILNNRGSTQANDFLTALIRARSEAQKRLLPVQVCKSDDTATCSTEGDVYWDSGWLVFVDVNSSGGLNSGEPILVRSSGLPGDNTLRSGDFADTVQFAGSGRANATGSFRLCDSRGKDYARVITISAVGRPSVSSTLGAASCP
jgi:type IV fimbrial biogenesis protein FimT